MTRRALRSKLFPLAVAAAGVLALVASAAWAVIPDPDGTIHACYSRDDGNLRVIDPATSQCKRRENPLQWSAAPAADLPDSFVSRRNDEASGVPRLHHHDPDARPRSGQLSGGRQAPAEQPR